jgi:hypothetical protein
MNEADENFLSPFEQFLMKSEFKEQAINLDGRATGMAK